MPEEGTITPWSYRERPAGVVSEITRARKKLFLISFNQTLATHRAERLG
jgi:hypothetical protein